MNDDSNQAYPLPKYEDILAKTEIPGISAPLDYLMYSTVRIHCEEPTGDGTHESPNSAQGTGFFFNLIDEDGNSHPVIITNKHVAYRDAEERTFWPRTVIRMATKDDEGKPGKYKNINLLVEHFCLPHPEPEVDLCAIHFAYPMLYWGKRNIEFYFVCIGKEHIFDSEQLAQLSPLESVVLIGYPIGIWDMINNKPIFTRGCTATHPFLDYEGQPYFLINAPCAPGSSGSPVLLYDLDFYRDKYGNLQPGPRIRLLGVLFARPTLHPEGGIFAMPIPTNLVRIPSHLLPMDLALIVQARKILDFVPLIKPFAQRIYAS